MKKIQLSIPKPCHENWNAMAQEDRGRFCGSCQKTVIDFSTMSDWQVAQFFKKPEGSVCGRFHVDQLDREVTIPRKRIPWVKYFFTIALPAFLFSKKSIAQGEVRQILGNVAMNILPKKSDTLKLLSVKPLPLTTISGTVQDESGLPIPHASLMFRFTNHGVLANEKGEFTIRQAKETERELVVSAIGYQSKTITLGEAEKIVLALSPMISGEVIVTGGVKKKKPSPKQTNNRCKIEAIENDSIGFGKTPFVFQPILPQVNEVSPVAEEQFIILGGVWATEISPIKKKPAAKAVITNEKQPVTSSFLVYPNPATANTVVTIKLVSISEGLYVVSLLDGGGAVVQQSSITITAKAPASFPLKQLPGGSYFLKLTDAKTGKSYSEAILVR